MSTAHSPILLVGGAPRVPIDAVRYLTVPATGLTACRLHDMLAADGLKSELLLSVDAQPTREAMRYENRAELEYMLQKAIQSNPNRCIVLSAAINDYQVTGVNGIWRGVEQHYPVSAKVPSGGERLSIELEPASKVVDTLKGYGHAGPLVAFKYEAAETVISSAQSLLKRVGAQLVVANSLCGEIQALVRADTIEICESRTQLLEHLHTFLSDEGFIVGPCI